MAFINVAALKKLAKANERRVSKDFLDKFDEVVAGLFVAYANKKDGSLVTMRPELIDIFPARLGFQMPSKNEADRLR